YDFLVKGDLTVEGLERSIRYALASHNREQNLSKVAYFDPLTGLPNRVFFLRRLTQLVSDNRAAGGMVGVSLINLDGTKRVNTRFGHDVGDEIIRTAAARLDAARLGDHFLARIGGDEFALVMDDVLLTTHALSTTQTLADAITGELRVGEDVHVITATCGVAVRQIRKDDDAVGTAHDILLNATHAMFDAKMAGRRRHTSNVALARVH
ncbi:MAG: GGDEF domain-containing protein, partial [Rhodospirillaceae bacterium]